MTCVLVWLFLGFLFHFSAARDRWFYAGVFALAFPPARIFFHASCFHNKVCLPYSPSLGEAIQMKAGSFRPVSAHSFLPVPLWCSLPCSCTPTFAADRPRPGVARPCPGPSAGSFHWDGSTCLQLAVGGEQVRAPCFCRYCSKLLIISEGFRACWKIASFAVITSLLAQQLLRRLCYWSGYWVSATRMLCPLLRDQRI